MSDGAPSTVDFTLVRDWSSAANGASVERFTGPDNSASGCGPGGLIDDRSGSVWGSDRAAGGQTIVIDLGAPVDVASVAIDPGAGCGDDPSAGLRDYELRGSTGPDGELAPLGAAGAFASAPGRSAARPRRHERRRACATCQLHAKTPQDTAADGSGADFLDVAELHVRQDAGLGARPVVGHRRRAGRRRHGGRADRHGDAARRRRRRCSSSTARPTAYGTTVAGAGARRRRRRPCPCGAVAGACSPRPCTTSASSRCATASATRAATPRSSTARRPPPPPPPTPPARCVAPARRTARLKADRKGASRSGSRSATRRPPAGRG